MNYLPYKIVPENVISKATSIVITALLVTSLFVGLIPMVPAASAATTYLSVSQTKIGADNAIQINVNDASLSTAPTIVVSVGANQTNLKPSMLRTPLGMWTIFIVNSTSSFATNTTTLRNPPTVSNASVANAATWPGHQDPGLVYVKILALQDAGAAGTVTVTYSERSESINLTQGETNVASATADRLTIPQNAKVYVNVTDPTENYDPTLKDGEGVLASQIQFNYTVISVNINGVPQTLASNEDYGNVTETAVNSGIFQLTIDLNHVNFNEVHGDLVTITVTDDDDASKAASVDLLVQANDGTLSAPTTITYSQSVNITLTDADRNLDTKSQESLITTGIAGYTVKVTANIGTTPVIGNLTLKETNKNTGIFTGTIRVNLGTAAALVLGSNNNTITFNVPAGSTATLIANYTDPVSVTVSHQAEARVTLTLGTPSIQFSGGQNSFLPAASMPATLVLTNPNANDNTTTIERITLNNITNFDSSGSGNGKITWLNANATSTGLPVIGKFNITETKSGVTRNLNYTGLRYKQFVETSANSGVFNLNFDLATNLNGTRTSGTTLTVKYYDMFTKTTISVTVTIGGTLATISLDRTEVPVAVGKEVRLTVTLADPDANVNPASPDSATVRVTVTNATNQRNIFNLHGHTLNVSLTETGINTSTFNGTIRYTIQGDTGIVQVYALNSTGLGVGNVTLRNTNSVFANSSNVQGRQMVNGKLIVSYSEPLATGGTISTSATIKASTASISVSPTVVSLNQSLTVIVLDSDSNLNVNAKDKVSVKVYEGTSFIDSLELTETANNSANFTGSKRVGAGDQSPFGSNFIAGETITVKYDDLANSASYYGTGLSISNLTVTATISTNTAVVMLDSTNYGPFSKITINVTDPDLALSTAADVKLSLIKTSKADVRGPSNLGVPANKTLAPGVFEWSLTLYVAGTTQKNILTDLVDTVTVYYVDAKDAAGNSAVVIAKQATVKSVTGTVSVSPSAVLVNEFFTVSVSDLDRNLDPSVINSVTVLVTTDSWPLGQNVTLPETADNSGTYSAQVKIVSGVPATSNEVRGATGDTITVKYTDPWNATGKSSSVTATGRVGVQVPPTQKVPASTPQVVDQSGNAVLAPSVGSVAVIQSQVKNNQTSSQTFTYIVQIKDANGVVVYISWLQDITLAAGATTTPGVSWTPTAAGSYTIEVFVWDSLTGAAALSPVFTQTVTVS